MFSNNNVEKSLQYILQFLSHLKPHIEVIQTECAFAFKNIDQLKEQKKACWTTFNMGTAF